MVSIIEFWYSRWGASYQACYCNVQSRLTEGSSGGFLFWLSLTPLFPAMSSWSRRWVHESHNCYMGGQQVVSNCFSYGIPCLVFLRYLTGPVLLIHINLCTWPISAVIKDVDSVYYLESLAISHLVRNFPFSWVSLFDEWLAELNLQFRHGNIYGYLKLFTILVFCFAASWPALIWAKSSQA
jgi:hypothetical protein